MEIPGKNLATAPQVKSARRTILIVQANGEVRTDLGRHFAHQDANLFKSVTPHARAHRLLVGVVTVFA